MDVTSVGDVNVDILSSAIKDYPARDGQELVDGIYMSTGGCSANFSKAAALLGLDVRFIGRLGCDFFGEYVRKDLSEIPNLDLRILDGERTGATIAIAFKDFTRSFLTYPGANSGLRMKDVDYDLISGRYLHVASFFLQGLRKETKKLLDYAHGKGMRVSFDTGFDPSGWKKADVSLVRKTLTAVDIFFPNQSEARAITGLKDKDDVCDALLDMGPGIVGLKMGKNGSYICTRDCRVRFPAYKVKVVDTTGAGDVFDAAFVYGHSKGWDLKEIGRFAGSAAAISTTGYGSLGYPSCEDALRLSGLKGLNGTR